jgi:hypothetical protein
MFSGLDWSKCTYTSTKEPNIKPAISKARLRRETLNDGVYGGRVGMSGNMRIMNDGFTNVGFRDNDSIDLLQNQQTFL